MTRFWLAFVAVLAGCGGGSEEESPPDPMARFQNQSMIVAPSDETNPSCAADPTSMDRATFASCVRLDLAKLPTDYEITHDVLSFRPEKGNASILIMGAVEGAPAPWYAIVGVAPSAAPGGASLLQPREAATLVMAGGTLVAGAGFTVTAPVIVTAAAATAVTLGTIYLINHREELVESTSRVIESVQTMFRSSGRPPSRPCTEGIPTGHTPAREAAEYWARCPQGPATR
jgi:hypothetical protein